MDKLLAGMIVPRPSRRSFLAGAAATFAAGIKPGPARASEKIDVVIIGAGLAGLNAALRLAEEGAKVLVLEADSRPGGRIRTLDSAPGRPEAGGSEVGPLYARTRRLISDLALGLYTPGRTAPGMAIHIDGRLLAPGAWANDRANRLPDAMRALPPYAVEGAMLAAAKPLTDAESWLQPEGAARDMPYDRMLRALGANDAALQHVAVGAQADRLSNMSGLWMLRRDQGRRQSAGIGSINYITGGMSRLTDAMAAKLGDQVRYGVDIVRINQDSKGVTAQARDGRQFSGARLLVTVPATVTRRIIFDPAPPNAQRAVWNRLPYGQGTSAFFPIKKAFWEIDGLPPATWSNRLPARAFVINNENGAYLWFYATGAAAARFHGMATPDVVAAAERSLVAVRPSVAGRLAAGSAFSWTRHPHALGTFASRHPGNLAAIQAVLKAAHGRIAFAGEHTADLASGIEGALESGERAAIELLG